MTEDQSPLTDEELSDHLDGAASPSVIARLAADPGARARLDALDRARRALAEPVDPPDTTTIDRLIGRALDEISTTDAPLAPVTTLGSRRRLPMWGAAAAVVLLFAAGLGLIISGRGDQSTDVTASSAGLAATEDDALASGAEAPSTTIASEAGANAYSDHSPTASTSGEAQDKGAALASAAPLVDLGTFADAAELRTALKASFPTTPVVPAESARTRTGEADPDNLDRCATLASTVLKLPGSASHQGVAQVDGESVLVFEFPTTSSTTGDPTTIIVGVRPAACDPVLTFER